MREINFIVDFSATNIYKSNSHITSGKHFISAWLITLNVFIFN